MNRHLPGTGLITISINGGRTGAGMRIRIDERRVDVVVPVTYVPVAAGRHRVEIEASSGLTTYGESRIDVDVAPGQQINLYFSEPMWIYGRGQLATTPRPRSWSPDWSSLAIGIGGTVLLLCLCGTGVSLWELLTG